MYRIEFYGLGTNGWIPSNVSSVLKEGSPLSFALSEIARTGLPKYKYRIFQDDRGDIIWEGRGEEALAYRDTLEEKGLYSLQVYCQGQWVAPLRKGLAGRKYDSTREAIIAIGTYGRADWSYRVRCGAEMTWWAGTPENARRNDAYVPISATVTATITSTEGTEMHNEPLTLPVEKVIERLEASLKIIQTERDDLQAKAEESREELYRVLRGLSKDQVAKLVEERWGNGPVEAAENVREMKTAGRLDYEERAPSPREKELEKFLSILRDANDKTLSIEPNGALYDLL